MQLNDRSIDPAPSDPFLSLSSILQSPCCKVRRHRGLCRQDAGPVPIQYNMQGPKLHVKHAVAVEDKMLYSVFTEERFCEACRLCRRIHVRAIH